MRERGGGGRGSGEREGRDGLKETEIWNGGKVSKKAFASCPQPGSVMQMAARCLRRTTWVCSGASDGTTDFRQPVICFLVRAARDMTGYVIDGIMCPGRWLMR